MQRVYRLPPGLGRNSNKRLVRNSRFTWLGELPHEQTRRRMAQCRALVLRSQLEGGANVISEAIVAGVPILASRIAGSIGLLGKSYPGFFSPGDTRGLKMLLHRVESDPMFLERLKAWCTRLRPQFTPQH